MPFSQKLITVHCLSQGVFKVFFTISGVKKLNLNWVSKTQLKLKILFYHNLFDTKKPYKKVKSSANMKQ